MQTLRDVTMRRYCALCLMWSNVVTRVTMPLLLFPVCPLTVSYLLWMAVNLLSIRMMGGNPEHGLGLFVVPVVDVAMWWRLTLLHILDIVTIRRLGLASITLILGSLVSVMQLDCPLLIS